MCLPFPEPTVFIRILLADSHSLKQQRKGSRIAKTAKFDPIALLNFTGGKSWHIRGKYLGAFVSINNVLIKSL
jgi:hypothetical protein